MEFKGISYKFFHNRKKLKNSKDEYFIQFRVTINRKSDFFSIKELPKIPTKYWSGKENRWVKESYPNSALINSFLIQKIAQLNEFLVKSKIAGKSITFDLIKGEFFRTGEVQTFNQFFDNHVETFRFNRPATKQAYKTSLKVLNEFNSAITFQELNENLVQDFIAWERSKKGNRDVTIDKHYRHISTIAKLATRTGLLQKNPLEQTRAGLKPEKAKRVYLTKEELDKLNDLKFLSSESHLERDRDIFVFQCYTGLYYKDVLALEEENLLKSKDKPVIVGSRMKNGENYIVPVRKKANEILVKFQQLRNDKRLFSGLSQEPVFNRSLKKLAEKAKISKTISNKVGRHTFTQHAIEDGLPRSFVTKMLGHAKESTTEHYYQINATHFINGFINHNFFQ
jgi:integrase